MTTQNITYLTGDATYPEKTITTPGTFYLPHVCNDVGAWGKGYVIAISKRWKDPAREYKDSKPYILGDIKDIQVNKCTHVINMIAQHGIYTDRNTGLVPIRYQALESCLTKLNILIQHDRANGCPPQSLHLPRIGCGLAGGQWSIVEGILLKTIPDTDIYVYDL